MVLGYSAANLGLAFATMLGAFGGFPSPPKIFLKLTSYAIVQWFLVFVLLYQGGASQDPILAAVMTGFTFLIYTFMKHIEDNPDDLVLAD